MHISRRTALGSLGAAGSAILLLPGPALGQLRRTPNAILGPFSPNAKPAEQDADLSLVKGRRAQGQLVEISGRVLDLRGRPVPRARVEIWQANAAGRYAHPADSNAAPIDPNFQGFGWLSSDRLGRYRFLSVKPGAYPDPSGALRPPHIHLEVRSQGSRLVTQMLFPGEPLNDTDRVLANVDRKRLTAAALGQSADGARRLGWDIILDLG